MTRARDYLMSSRAAEPGDEPSTERRERYDVERHLKQLQRSCADERVELAEDRRRNLEMREAVVLFGRRTKIVMVGFVLLFTVMVGIAFYLIDRNREAIEVGCLVVVQVVRDSGANSGKQPHTPAGEAQARITATFYRSLFRGLSAGDRAAVLRDQAIVRRAGGAIPEPRCAEIARDPGRVRRDTLQKP